MADNLYWVWLAECIGPACRDLEALIEQFGSPFDIFSADESLLYHIPSVSEATTERLCRPRSLERAYQIIDRCTVTNIGILCYDDPAYPSRLRSLRNPPAVLYYCGKLPNFAQRLAMAVVGTRSMSEYGGRTSYKISYELASAGVLIVSGMALGVDGVANAAALAAGADTVAVLGCGVDVTYPPAHARLRNEIIRHGAVISEYPPGAEASAAHFPQRNRIISGLTHGTLVVEADLRSGALITAREALAQGRDLFAVPGNIGEFNAAGTNELIHAGANLVLSAKDVLDNYTFLYRKMLNLPAYAASVEHSDLNAAFLDELGVAARPADFKYAKRGQSVARGEKERPPAVTKSPEPQNIVSAPAPAKKSPRKPLIRHPGEPKPTAKKSRPAAPAPEAAIQLSDDCRQVLDLIPDDRAISSDTLIRSGVSPSLLTAGLTQLSLLGLIEQLPGNLYIRSGD